MKQKLDKSHIESIRELRQNFANNANAVGNVTIEREFLKEQLEQIELAERRAKEQEEYQAREAIRREKRRLEQIEHESKKYLQEFKDLKQQEETLFAKLKERYGDGQINIEEGTFDPL